MQYSSTSEIGLFISLEMADTIIAQFCMQQVISTKSHAELKPVTDGNSIVLLRM